ncbi:MAG: hypothetical protein ACLTXH_02760 [Enterobacter hormaechei]
MLVVGLYMHIYWNLRHPAPEPVNASVAKPETQLSEMHYVYVSKPFPHPQPKVAPVPVDVPPMQDLPINSDDADWQQGPTAWCRTTLAGDFTRTEAHEHDTAPASTGSEESSLTELFKQALKSRSRIILKEKSRRRLTKRRIIHKPV